MTRESQRVDSAIKLIPMILYMAGLVLWIIGRLVGLPIGGIFYIGAGIALAAALFSSILLIVSYTRFRTLLEVGEP